MKGLMSVLCLFVVLGAGCAVVAYETPTVAAPAPSTLMGTIDAVGANGLSIATDVGRTQVVTTAGTRVFNRLPARLEDIKPGDFIAVAARKEADGSLTAVSINIFAPSMRGVAREGQFPMESGDIMTNAVVTQYVSRVSGRMLTMACKDCTAAIAVPSGTAIHRLMVSTVGALKAGMHVTVRGIRNGDGSLDALSITVESPK